MCMVRQTMSNILRITVAFATPEQQIEIPLQVESNCTIAVAIKRSGILAQFPHINFHKNKVGLNGKIAKLDALMQDGDRVEIYRPLLIDPKEARRARS